MQKGFGLAIFMWLAYTLSMADYATFGLLLALQTGVATLAGAGIIESVVGLVKRDNSQHARVSWLFSIANGAFVYLSMVAVVVAIVIYALPIWHANLSVVGQLSVLVGAILSAHITLQASLVRLEERHRTSMALSFIGPVTGLCASAIAVFIWKDADSFFVGYAIGLLAACFGFFVTGLGHFGISLTPAALDPIRKTIGSYMVIALLTWLSGYGNAFIVKYLFSADDVARFTFAYTVSSVMQLVATSTNQVWGPRFLKLVHELQVKDMERLNLRFFTIQGVILGVTGFAILLLLPITLEVLGGNLRSYRDINLELVLFFSAYAVSIPWWHSQNYYLVHSFGHKLKDIVFITTIGGLAIWLFLMYILGTLGIYLGFMVQMLIRSLVTFLWAKKKWGLHVSWLGPIVAIILFLIGAVAGRAVLDMVIGA